MSINYPVDADVISRLEVVLPSCTTLVIGTSTLSGATGVLASFTLAGTPFTYSVRTATLAGTPLSATASAAGTAALAELRDSGGTARINGLTVGTSNADIIISPSTSIALSASVTVQSGTITG